MPLMTKHAGRRPGRSPLQIQRRQELERLAAAGNKDAQARIRIHDLKNRQRTDQREAAEAGDPDARRERERHLAAKREYNRRYEDAKRRKGEARNKAAIAKPQHDQNAKGRELTRLVAAAASRSRGQKDSTVDDVEESDDEEPIRRPHKLRRRQNEAMETDNVAAATMSAQTTRPQKNEPAFVQPWTGSEVVDLCDDDEDSESAP